MGRETGIEWTDATWNPIRGCSRVSQGCVNCYAERVAARFSKPGQAYEGLAEMRVIGAGTENERSEPHWTGKVALVEEHLADPLKWRKSRRIFVNSMSDLFHEGVSDLNLVGIFAVMANTHIATGHKETHTFQILTKRPERMREFMSRLRWAKGLAFSQISGRAHVLNNLPFLEGETDTWVTLGEKPRKPLSERDMQPADWIPPNIWLGVSVEDQKTADERIPLLLQTPAAVRFISYEPALGPVDLSPYVGFLEHVDFKHGLDWVICGGESGIGARPMHPDWARTVRDQCQAAGVAFFFKQWGEWYPSHEAAFHDITKMVGFERIGKKKAGALLDGKAHREFPAVQSSAKVLRTAALTAKGAE